MLRCSLPSCTASCGHRVIQGSAFCSASRCLCTYTSNYTTLCAHMCSSTRARVSTHREVLVNVLKKTAGTEGSNELVHQPPTLHIVLLCGVHVMGTENGLCCPGLVAGSGFRAPFQQYQRFRLGLRVYLFVGESVCPFSSVALVRGCSRAKFERVAAHAQRLWMNGHGVLAAV